MPVVYFKCECGTEHRDVRPMSHHACTQNKRGNWELDLTLYRKLGPAPPALHTCQSCGKEVTSSMVDPKGVPTKFLFNYMAEDY